MKAYPILLTLMLSLLGIAVFESYALAAGGRVDITPRRVILSTRERAGEFTLLNRGTENSTIRVSIINYKQDENGVYETLDGPLNPAFDPEEVLRLSPRQFTLPVEGRQKVRFSIRKPADLPAGEYRFHLVAKRLAEFGPAAPTGEGEKSITMVPNIGAAIPVIIRHGETSTSVAITDARYTPSNPQQKPELSFTLNRTGNASAIGTAKVLWIPQSGSGEEIGIMTNLNVFTEIDRRFVKVNLKRAPTEPGQFRIVYLNDETKTPYAEISLQK